MSVKTRFSNHKTKSQKNWPRGVLRAFTGIPAPLVPFYDYKNFMIIKISKELRVSLEVAIVQSSK